MLHPLLQPHFAAYAATTRQQVLQLWQQRFEANPHRHSGQSWPAVAQRLQAATEAQWLALYYMEATGGQPDVVLLPADLVPKDSLCFCDCAPETPAGRRSLCYDEEALHSRKQNKPTGSVLGMAEAMGVALLNEAVYRVLQQYQPLDTKTSTWLLTPPTIRSKGGAIFGDYRYGQVFVYHNGAESYYAARGFRGMVVL
jgi:hypothetical protein